MSKKDKNNKGSVSKLDAMPINTVLGPDIVFKGDIHGDSIIRIDGKLEGNVALKQGIILGEKADVTGNIESEYVIVYGHITGNIKSKELLIKTDGKVDGDIYTEAIEIEMGGEYNGKLQMQKKQEPAANHSSKEKK